jgi:sialate O-acetylesterase
VAYGYQNVTYLGPIVANIAVAADSSKVNVTYSNQASPSIELRNKDGFEVCLFCPYLIIIINIIMSEKVCCAGVQVCSINDQAWVATPASSIEGSSLTIALAVPSSCASKPINALRYLWRETPCLFKQAAIYNSLDSNLPAPPYIHYL